MEIKIAEKNNIEQIMNFRLLLFKKWDKIDPIDKINQEWFKSQEHFNLILKYINCKEKKIFLAFDKEICIGYLLAEINVREPFLKEVGYISETYISNEFRGKKIASNLLNKALSWFKEKNISWTTVSTHSLDKEAITFWEKKGYKEYNKFFKMNI